MQAQKILHEFSPHTFLQAGLILCKCWFDINRLNPDYTTLTKSEYESEAWHGGFTKPRQSVAGLLPPGETEGPSALCRLTKILIPSVLAPAGGILVRTLYRPGRVSYR